MLHLFQKHKRRFYFSILSFIFFLSFFIPAKVFSQEPERVSKFGEYKGYAEEKYDSNVRSSEYVTMRDGIKLAVDIIRPAKKGRPAEEALPAIWTHCRYRRASYGKDGQIRSQANSPLYERLIRCGYVMVVVDVRGSGASFGTCEGVFTKKETRDAYEITEWIASQPWCDGNVGMFGGSYLGITQLMAASTQPPHLKAIFPVVALFDLYATGYPGGIYHHDFVRTWSDLTRMLDTTPGVVPVDEDKEGKLLEQAIKLHEANKRLHDVVAPLRFRDSRVPETGVLLYKEWHPAGFIQEINESGIPMYLWCGWFDSFTKDGFQMFRNFTAPKKMVIGAWSHSPKDPDILNELIKFGATEQHRWFDYWLKGIDNNIMDEPAIYYHRMIHPKQNEWMTAQAWPLPAEKRVEYYFHGGPAESVQSVNDGLLSPEKPSGTSCRDIYTVDYSTTTGQTTRWDNAVGGGYGYPDLTPNDEKGLTYTTEPLLDDLEITGHVVAHLWISSTAEDGDFFLYLEEVDSEGISHYVTEGNLRASHRMLHEPPYDNLGLPFHRSNEEDVEKLKPGDPGELVFDLQPTSNVFNAGHRLRVTVTCADKDNALTPVLSPPPDVSIYRCGEYASYVDLPVIGAEEEGQFSFVVIVLIVLVIVVVVIIGTIGLRKKFKP